MRDNRAGAMVPPEVTVEWPAMYRAQHRAMIHRERFGIVEATTKAGKTVAALLWQGAAALSDRRRGIHGWVAPVYRQAEIAYERAASMLPASLATRHDGRLELALANGARWTFRSGEQPDNLFGDDWQSAVIDEASRCREEVWHAVRSLVTATGGPVRLIGNVRGRRNWAWRLARSAEQGREGWHYARLTAVDAVAGGVMPQSEIDSARRDLAPDVFAELYMAVASDSGANPFGLDAIASRVGPLSTSAPACWGWDLARGRKPGSDWTCGVALDDDGRVCRVERWQAPWMEQIDRIVAATGRTPAMVDATGAGDPVAELLLDRGLDVEPYTFTAQSKQDLMAGLAIAIRTERITFPEGVVRDELDAFEFSHTDRGRVTYSAPEGCHDDAVCALALAWHMGESLGVAVPHAPSRTPRLVPPPPRRGETWQSPIARGMGRRIIA